MTLATGGGIGGCLGRNVKGTKSAKAANPSSPSELLQVRLLKRSNAAVPLAYASSIVLNARIDLVTVAA